MSREPVLALDALDGGRPTSGWRRAALLLHSAADEDRRWLMASLPDAQRAALQPLLDELATLAFPRDRRLVDDALNATSASPPPPPSRDDDLGIALDQAAAVLGAESPEVIARLLQARPWSWSAALLERLPRAHAQAVESMRDRLPARHAPAMSAALVAEFVDAVNARRIATHASRTPA